MDERDIESITRMVIENIGKQASMASISKSSTSSQADTEGRLKIPVGISARHVHLTREHVEALFGKGYQLTRKKELMGGQYAAEELVTIVSSKLKAIENVRVLGPVRNVSQVEVSRTDSIKMGISVPLKESGDIKGSAPIAIIGPMGAIYLEEGCIIAARHIHMSPKNARLEGVGDGDMVSVKVPSERGIVFNNVKVRVDDTYNLEMHVDTDEGNASLLNTGDTVVIVNT